MVKRVHLCEERTLGRRRVQSIKVLIYQYILGHQEQNPQQYVYHIITEEQQAYALSPTEQTKSLRLVKATPFSLSIVIL